MICIRKVIINSLHCACMMPCRYFPKFTDMRPLLPYAKSGWQPCDWQIVNHKACLQLMPLKKPCEEEGEHSNTQLVQSQCDSRPQERVLFSNPQPRELVSANVATFLDQTVKRLVTGNRTASNDMSVQKVWFAQSSYSSANSNEEYLTCTSVHDSHLGQICKGWIKT